jgi:hypothetical protein
MKSVIVLLLLVATVRCARPPHSSRHLLQGPSSGDTKQEACELLCTKTYDRNMLECMRATGLANVHIYKDTIGCFPTAGNKCGDDFYLPFMSFEFERKASASEAAFRAAEAQCKKSLSPQQDNCKAGCSSKRTVEQVRRTSG